MRLQRTPADETRAAEPMTAPATRREAALQQLAQCARLVRRLYRAKARLLDTLDACAREGIEIHDATASGFGRVPDKARSREVRR